MTQDEIIRMAREAAHPFHLESELAIAWWRDNFLPKFAALVAAHTLEKDADLTIAYMKGVSDGAAHEREACAKVCEEEITIDDEEFNDGVNACAAAIRARGENGTA